jgi:uncharacterized membrane protein
MLPGLKAMLNYHPLMVHFPIALWLAALLYAALSLWRSNDEWHRTAVRLLYLGTLGACAAVGSGWIAEKSVPLQGPVRDAFSVHETIMLITTSFAIGLCIYCFALRARFTKGLRSLLLVGLVVLAVLMTIGADRGAQMVYQYATSVNLPTPGK